MKHVYELHVFFDEDDYVGRRIALYSQLEKAKEAAEIAMDKPLEWTVDTIGIDKPGNEFWYSKTARPDIDFISITRIDLDNMNIGAELRRRRVKAGSITHMVSFVSSFENKP